MYYTVYKTTNRINGKFYIGSHKTKNPNDDYLGSGKYLKYAIKKYGRDNFTKEVLFVFENSDDMYAKEAEIVNADFISESNTYNLKQGGFGGFDYINDNPSLFLTERRLQALKENHKLASAALTDKWNNDEEFRQERLHHLATMAEISRTNNPGGPFLGKTHTDETKRKIGDAAKKNSTGSNNSQYGTMWINNGCVNKKIKKELAIPDGWVKGRLVIE